MLSTYRQLHHYVHFTVEGKGLETLSTFPMSIYLVRSRVWIWIQACLLLRPGLLTSIGNIEQLKINEPNQQFLGRSVKASDGESF